MASKTEQFLKLKKKKAKTKTVTVKIQGQNFDFDIRQIEPSLLSEIQLANTVGIPSSVQGGPVTEGANPVELSLDVCIAGIIAPDLRDADLQDHFGVYNDRDLLYEIFKGDMDALGELFTAIVEFINPDAEDKSRPTSPEDVQEAKN